MSGMFLAAPGGVSQLYVDDVFSTYLYTGNGSTQTINNGIDLAGKGGVVWLKNRGTTASHMLYDTARGANRYLQSDSTGASIDGTVSSPTLSAFNSNGFSLSDSKLEANNPSWAYASWTFRNADKFFTHTTVSHTNGTATNINLSTLGTVGQVHAKITTTTGDWITWHRSLTAGNNLRLNTTAAQSTTNAWLSVSGTTATLSGSAPTGTYVIYAWAHDTSADGIIQCGSFTTDGSGNATVNLGWEPQYLMVKRTDSSTAGSWVILDQMRGFPGGKTASTTPYAQGLVPNSSSAEGNVDEAGPTATGFAAFGRPASSTYIYLAIRRPNKPPKTGAEVYNAIAYAGDSDVNRFISTGMPVDFLLVPKRSGSGSITRFVSDRLTQSMRQTVLTDTDTTGKLKFDSNTGIRLGNGVSSDVNDSSANFILEAFRRAPGVHDQICYNGTGANKTEAHNLTVQPELWISKRRNGTGSWVIGSTLLNANEKLVMPSPDGRVTDATAWNSTYPTASNISLGTLADVNASGGTYALWMWATLAGISRVGTYTGNGSSQTLDCGFTTGARFVMVIRLTAGLAQDIYIWDTARGIVAGNDPHLSLNTTAAEVTTDDSVDPYTAGFTVNQVAATNINVTGATYIFLAYA